MARRGDENPQHPNLCPQLLQEDAGDLLFNEESLRNIDKQTYVVKGTPGIGKTTMLYYLPSECLSEASPFTAVLFRYGRWRVRCSKGPDKMASLKPSSAEAKCIRTELEKPSAWWMFAPDGKVENTELSFNQQKPCTVYGLHRLVVVASAGSELSQLIGKDGDVRVPDVLQLPVWRPPRILYLGDDEEASELE